MEEKATREKEEEWRQEEGGQDAGGGRMRLGGMGGRLETETKRFSHVQTKGFEALDPDPQTQVHLTKQVWLVFQAVSSSRVRAPRGPNSLLPSPHK